MGPRPTSDRGSASRYGYQRSRHVATLSGIPDVANAQPGPEGCSGDRPSGHQSRPTSSGHPAAIAGGPGFSGARAPELVGALSEKPSTVRYASRCTGPGWEGVARRCIDITGAALILAVFALVMLVIALWIRLDSRGPVLLRQRRVGLRRHPFTIYKFRSMYVGGDDAAHRALIAAELRGEDTRRNGSTKIDRDPRITRVGRVLRKTSLDELPQLWNVLRGDMSLVGPRPCLEWEADMFPVEFADRFDVRPGLTGLWQVSGRSTLGTLDMLRMDVEYVRNQRLSRDIAILLATIPSMLRGDGAQ